MSIDELRSHLDKKKQDIKADSEVNEDDWVIVTKDDDEFENWVKI